MFISSVQLHTYLMSKLNEPSIAGLCSNCAGGHIFRNSMSKINFLDAIVHSLALCKMTALILQILNLASVLYIARKW